MEQERKENQEPKELDNTEVTELEDKDLEDASGGAAIAEQPGGNFNCIC